MFIFIAKHMKWKYAHHLIFVLIWNIEMDEMSPSKDNPIKPLSRNENAHIRAFCPPNNYFQLELSCHENRVHWTE